MLLIIKSKNYDFIFASRYEKNCSSEDDTIITKIGNFFFLVLAIYYLIYIFLTFYINLFSEKFK